MACDRHDLSEVPGPVLLAYKRAIVERWSDGRTLAAAVADAAEVAYARALFRGCGELRARLARHLVEDVGAEMRREVDQLTGGSVG